MTTGRPEWWFYHLERTTLETAAGPLLEKCLERGWRVLAVSQRAERRAALDETLWTYADGSFLPHGRAEAEGLEPADQPILISGSVENANNADVCLLLDGQDMDAQAEFERCLVMFDGGDNATRQVARNQFKVAKAAGLTVRYFQQTARGGWTEAGKG